jgi:acyl-CoA thioester hydrolase
VGGAGEVKTDFEGAKFACCGGLLKGVDASFIAMSGVNRKNPCMSGEDTRLTNTYVDQFTVPAEAIDLNGHVNNVAYVQWMQDLAVSHWNALGGEAINREFGSTWVARSHWIEYLHPAYEGDILERKTWVASIGRVRSTRKYSFKRVSDGVEIARGETDWVFIDVKGGRPTGIPEKIHGILPVLADPS